MFILRYLLYKCNATCSSHWGSEFRLEDLAKIFPGQCNDQSYSIFIIDPRYFSKVLVTPWKTVKSWPAKMGKQSDLNILHISKIHEDMTWAPLATMAGHSRVALTWKSFGWTLCKHCAALFSAPNPNSTLEDGCWRRAKIKIITMLTCRCEVGGWWCRVARYKACVCEHLSPLLKTWVFIQHHTAL